MHPDPAAFRVVMGALVVSAALQTLIASLPHPVLGVIVLVVLFPWIAGPVPVRFRQWSSARFNLAPYYPKGPDAPPLLRRALWELTPLGFAHLRTFRSLNQVPGVTGYISVYYNPVSLEVAKVVAARAANREVAYYVFATELSDGTELTTNNNTLPIVTPPLRGKVRIISFPGVDEAARLCAVHRARVKNGLTRRPEIDDPYAYVLGKETRALDHHVACGYYYRSDDGRRLLPTWKGALLMTWKGLWPVPPVRRAWRRLCAWFALRRLVLDEQRTLYDEALDGLTHA